MSVQVYHIDKALFFAFMLASAIILLSKPVWADSVINRLTETNVSNFITDTTHITTDNSGGLSSSKIKDYLDKHIEDKARFKSSIKYHIPGMPPQKAVISLSKAEFMDQVDEGTKKIEGYETVVEIEEIKIDSGGKKAFVKTTNTEYAMMPIPTDTGGVEEVPMEGVSNCRQILSLNSGVIQMFSANCTTNVMFLDN